jgi:Skp family chaperone for outer membrane proteins
MYPTTFLPKVKMIFNRKARHAAAALETAEILLQPLREILPEEIVNRVVQNLWGGSRPDLGGQILLQGLIAWRDSVMQAAEQRSQERQERSLSEIRSKESQQNKKLLELQNKINSLEQEIEKQKLEKEFYQKTIQDQNSIVAEQHERLIALLGRARS